MKKDQIVIVIKKYKTMKRPDTHISEIIYNLFQTKYFPINNGNVLNLFYQMMNLIQYTVAYIS